MTESVWAIVCIFCGNGCSIVMLLINVLLCVFTLIIPKQLFFFACVRNEVSLRSLPFGTQYQERSNIARC